MDRYKATKRHTDKVAYKTTMIPVISEQADDLYIISRDGDRLDLLANEFYHDPSLWWVIAEANNLGKGTTVIEPGIQVRIPKSVTDVFNDIRAAEENR
tara:strand:+ start:555 stop:848 length:294 start_codon:yes stop_codon:yes gene_type:complete